jgi:hypothetical protein
VYGKSMRLDQCNNAFMECGRKYCKGKDSQHPGWAG